MTRSRSWLPGALLAMGLLALAGAGVLLLDARGCDEGDQRCVDVRRLFRIEDLLELHPVLQWRQRPRLDATFEGTRVVTDDLGLRVVPGRPLSVVPPRYTVVAYGASPDFGYGVEAEEAWPALVEERLKAEGLSVRVVNAGEIGYSSLQGTRLYDLTHAVLRPDVVVFTYLVNDAEELRFFYPNGRDDRSTPRPSSGAVLLRNALSNLQPFVALRRVVARYAVRAKGGAEARRRLEVAAVRTLPEDYEANLRGLVARARHDGAQPVLLVMPFRLPQPVPDAPPEAKRLLDEAGALHARNELAAALAMVERAVALDPVGRRGWQLKGTLLQDAGKEAEAAEAFEQATRHLAHQCVRTAREYNDLMRHVGRETGTPVVDVTPLLGGEAAFMDLYVKGDYVHPNARGHRWMAQAVAPVIAGLLRQDRGGGRVEEGEQAPGVGALGERVE